MKQWCRGFCHDGESGQAMVVVALAITGLLLVVALALDGGYALVERREAQNAADAAALAAGKALAQNKSDAQIKAELDYYIAANGGEAVTAVYMPSGQAVGGGSVPSGTTEVRVTATNTFDAFFSTLMGFTELNSAAQAQAEKVGGQPCGGNYAIWGNNASENQTVHFSGSNVTVGASGIVHSNSTLHSTGVNLHALGGMEYVTNWQLGGSNIWVGLAPYTLTHPNGSNLYMGTPSVEVTTVQPMPVQYNIADYAPGGAKALEAQAAGKYFNHGGQWKVNGSNYHVPSGLHYVSGNVHFSGSNIYFDQGPVTIVSTGTMKTSGCNLLSDWSPYSGGLTIFSNDNGPNAVDTAGSNVGFKGIIYAPRGRISYSGSNSVAGSLIGDKVQVSGSNATINFTPGYCPPSTGTGARLTQ